MMSDNKEQLGELRDMISDLPEYAPANGNEGGGAYELEKTIVEFRQEDDESESYVAELLAYQVQTSDHRAIRDELKEYGDLCIIHEDADSLRLELRNIDRDIVPELEGIGWRW